MVIQEDQSMKTIQAALYARVSSDHQTNGQTIASQLSALRERMRMDDCLPPAEREFVDEGWSGATLMRPALERLRDAAAYGGIDRLYVHSPDRLARKYAYQVLLIDELQRSGAEIVFLNHAMGQTPEDDLLLQVQGMVAEYERAKILERSRRGKRHKAKTGQVSVLAGAPYGYRYVNVHEGAGCARYEIVEEHAQVVRQIFHWVGRERATIAQVCRRLEEQRILTARGASRWDRGTVWGMLRNPAYRGQAGFGKTRIGEPRPRLRPQRRQRLSGGPAITAMPAEQWQSIPVPALIDADLFAAVQDQLQENRERSRIHRRGARYLLQGLLVCKQCGYAYYGKPIVSAKGHLREYGYYRCIGSDGYRFGGQRICTNNQLRTDCLEQAVWQEVRGLLTDPHRLTREYERRLQALAQPADDVKRRSLDSQLRQCRQGVVRLIDAYAEGYLEKAEFESRVTHLRERQQALEHQIEQIDNEALSRTELQLVVGHLEDFAAKVTVSMDDMGFLTQRDLIRTLVKRVEIDREHVHVVFRVAPSTNEPGGAESLKDCRRRAEPAAFRSTSARHLKQPHRWLTGYDRATGTRKQLLALLPEAPAPGPVKNRPQCKDRRAARGAGEVKQLGHLSALVIAALCSLRHSWPNGMRRCGGRLMPRVLIFRQRLVRVVDRNRVGACQGIVVQHEVRPAGDDRLEQDSSGPGSKHLVAKYPRGRLDAFIEIHPTPVAIEILPQGVPFTRKTAAEIDNRFDTDLIAHH
jgi:site-specific DNA recombinase